MPNIKQSFRLYSAILLSVIVAVVVVGLGVKAYSCYGVNPKIMMENVQYYEAQSKADDTSIGALSSPDVYGYLYVHGRFMEGQAMLASSTSNATETVPASYLMDYSGLDYTPGDAAVTLTLPATSTIVGFIGNAGDCVNWRIRNLDATAATSTTIAAGTGMDLVENENGDVVIEGGNEAQLRFCRELDTDITVYVDEYIAAD